MRALSASVRERLRAKLEETALGAAGSAFAEAVVMQRAHPLGEHPSEENASAAALRTEATVASQVLALIALGGEGEAEVERAAHELANDPALLAAFFQNLDLLPPDGSPAVNGIALMIVGALQRLADTPGGDTPEAE